MSSHLKAELVATCSTLGRLHKGEYLIEPDCIESVKNLIRYLKKDDDTHEIRRYLGESKVLQNDLIHIVKSCPEKNCDLFDVTLRLLINLTTPALLFYGEEIPTEKTDQKIYLNLVGYNQEYKVAFCDVQFWNKVCGKLTDLFETDWTERSADDGIQIERILMLLRNVLQVPADVESEKRPENDITIHDKVLWSLRQSQILELLLFVSSNRNEEQYYLNLLEIFSLILREQNPKVLARCDIQRSVTEKSKESEDLVRARESERKSRNKYLNMRNFNATFVMKGVKSLSDRDVVCHTSLDKATEFDVNSLSKKAVRTRRNRIPVESERTERRSTFSVRLFLKEFCLEFLTNSFGHLMAVVKSKLDSGKSLANDQTYYFWALKFFLNFATASDLDVDLVKDFLATESFHFVLTSIENSFEHLISDKKKTAEWVRRIHLILKAYHSFLETLLWMDRSKNPLTRSISREIKSQIFYVVEYREMTLHVLLKYDPAKFPLSYLRDLIEITHLFVKLLEEYSKQTRFVVQKVKRKKSLNKKKKKAEAEVETATEKWEKIKDDVYDTLCSESVFPEIPPFDAALEIPIDDQRGRAMKRIQMLLHDGRIADGIGLLRSARQVWPENDYFGNEGMSVEDETMALQEICLADLEEVDGGDLEKEKAVEGEEDDEEEGEGFEDELRTFIVEQDFDIMEYKKRLVNKKVVEGCGILLKNYKNNSNHTNHCVVKLLHRIGWECCMPAMLFQASIFWTLLKIMRDKSRCYDEINTFAVNLMQKFRKHASKNPVVFLELLFWKEHNIALEIQHGYQEYGEKEKPGRKRSKKKKSEEKIGEEVEGAMKVRRKARKAKDGVVEGDARKNKSRKRKAKTNEEIKAHSEIVSLENLSGDEGEPVTTAIFNSDLESSEDEMNSMSDSFNLKNGRLNEDCIYREEVNKENKLEGCHEAELFENHAKNTRKRQGILRDSEDDERSSQANKKSLSLNGRSSRRQVFLDSSDDEGEKESINARKEKDDESEVGTVPRHDYASDNSNTSNTSSKKRGREKGGLVFDSSPEGSDKNDRLKLKRIRYIGSDSDVENCSSGEEGSVSMINRGRRRRLAVIDSDSDLEMNSLDEK